MLIRLLHSSPFRSIKDHDRKRVELITRRSQDRLLAPDRQKRPVCVNGNEGVIRLDFGDFEANGGPLWTRTRDPSLIRTVL